MNKALNYAFCLLKFRPRSEYELRQRLKKRGFQGQEIKETIFFLQEKSFLNDQEFAREWAESRLRRPFGFKRIRQELKIKGIKQELIDQTLRELNSKYSEDEMIQEAMLRRWEKLKHIEPVKAKRRLFMYLLRRGFSADIIRDSIREL